MSYEKVKAYFDSVGLGDRITVRTQTAILSIKQARP